jgi:glycosyltransferase involved in cell wall biosynthesis
MKLLYLVTEDWYFYSHRLPMAKAAQRAGYDVIVAVNVGAHRAAIEAEGIRVIPFSLERRSLNPFRALGHIYKLHRLYRRERPDVVHHIAMKPVLIGSLAAWSAGVPHVIDAFAGLGFVFTADTILARVLRAVLVPLFRVLLRRRNTVVLLQNDDDLALLRSLRMVDRAVIIRGSGVDLARFAATPLPVSPSFVCVYAGRMIGIKGLATLKEAFALLECSHPHVRLWLCGEPDAANPGSWDEAALRAWEESAPNVTYKGRRAMTEIWPQAHLAVQPSWGGEGVPKSLLEAAASGRAIVATDVPGCRDVVKANENGLLVPPRDARALADAIVRLADNPALCAAMASRSRAVVEGELSAEGVGARSETLYRSF